METERCPVCGEPSVLIGQIVAGHEHYGYAFVPNFCRPPLQEDGVPVHGGPRACISCGHLWMSLDPGRLRKFVASFGGELARQALDEIDLGPYRDLPDTALAREIAEGIAEIDALARSGRTGAVGRYREIRGVPWDRALKEASQWAHLTREEKLALFGWTPKKKKTPVDDLDSPFP